MMARLLFVALVLAGQVASAAQYFHYGALAVDRRDGFFYGWANDHPTMEAAGDRALAECTKRGGRCHVVLVWSGRGCGAYRTIESNVGTAYGWGVALTREEADSIAMAEATKRSGGRPASRFVWGCNAAEADAFRPLYDAGASIEPRVLTGHTDEVKSVAISPDGRIVASAGGYDKTIRFWDVATGAALRTMRHTKFVHEVAFSPAGDRLASAGNDTTRVWEVSSGRELLEMPEFDNSMISVAFSPDGRVVAAGAASSPDYGTKDGSVRLWDSSSGALLATHREVMYVGVFSLAWSEAGLLVAGGDNHNGSDVRALTDGSWRTVSPSDSIAYDLTFSPDGTRLASGSNDGTIKIFDASSFALLRRIQVMKIGAVRSVAFSPDGRELASGDTEGLVKIWDPDTGALLDTLSGHTKPVDGVAYAPSGGFLASAGDRTVRLWPRAVGGSDRRYREVLEAERGRTKSVAKAKALSGASEARRRRNANAR